MYDTEKLNLLRSFLLPYSVFKVPVAGCLFEVLPAFKQYRPGISPGRPFTTLDIAKKCIELLDAGLWFQQATLSTHLHLYQVLYHTGNALSRL